MGDSMTETQKAYGHKQDRETRDMVWLENMKWELQTLQAKNDLTYNEAVLLKLRREGVLK